jgi:hypothetical protein
MTEHTSTGLTSTGLTSIEREARDFLIERAKNADPSSPRQAVLTYAELCLAIDPRGATWKKPRYQGLRTALKNISADEISNGRPMIGALVVRPEDRTPDEDFSTLIRELRFKVPTGSEREFWNEQISECIRHWAKPGRPTGSMDAVGNLKAAFSLACQARGQAPNKAGYDAVQRVLDAITSALQTLKATDIPECLSPFRSDQPTTPDKRKRQTEPKPALRR